MRCSLYHRRFYRLSRLWSCGLRSHWCVLHGLLRFNHRRTYRLRRRNWRMLYRLIRLLHRRLLYRLLRTCRLRRLTLVRRLVLVLRRTRRVMLPSNPRGVIDLVDTNFTHAFNIVISIVFRLIVGITRLHSLHWSIAEHR